MSSPSSQLADDLARRFKALNRTRIKIANFETTGLITKRDLERVYEGLFLSAHVAFEGFIEQLFIGLLVSGQGVESSRTDIVPRVTVRTHQIAREMVFGPNRQYIDWFPYKRTMDIAKIYFRGGRPFTELAEAQKDYLTKSHTIRNAIAHQSRYSLKQFEKQVVASTPLPSREKTPAGYLRGHFRITPVQTRYENFIIQMLLIAKQLSR